MVHIEISDLVKYSESITRIRIVNVDNMSKTTYFQPLVTIPTLPESKAYRLSTPELKAWCGVDEKERTKDDAEYMVNPDLIPLVEQGNIVRLEQVSKLIQYLKSREISRKTR